MCVQAVLAALEACPKNPDVQRWGCQVLVSLFGDPVIAAAHRQTGVAAVIRALATLQDVEKALKDMKASAAAAAAAAAGGGVGVGKGGGATTGLGAVGVVNGGHQSVAVRDRWARAIKKVN